MNEPSWKSVVCILPLVLVACSGDDDTGDESSAATSGPLSDADFRRLFPSLACRQFEDCCRDAGVGYDAAFCRALFTPAPSPGATFDAAMARSCIDGLEAAPATCEENLGVPACDRVYGGTAAPGESCNVDSDCAFPERDGIARCDPFESVCVHELRGSAGQTCQRTCEGGTCVGIIEEGTAQFVYCHREDGLYCDGTCTALGAAGALCSGDWDCVDEAYCDGELCQARAASGAACTTSDECAEEAYCDGGACRSRVSEGAPCTTGEQCIGGSCVGSACGADDPLAGLVSVFLPFLCGG